MADVDVQGVLRGLKGFQRDAVDHLIEHFYPEDGLAPSRRFLIADDRSRQEHRRPRRDRSSNREAGGRLHGRPHRHRLRVLEPRPCPAEPSTAQRHRQARTPTGDAPDTLGDRASSPVGSRRRERQEGQPDLIHSGHVRDDRRWLADRAMGGASAARHPPPTPCHPRRRGVGVAHRPDEGDEGR